MAENITDLRNHLFATLKAVKSGEMELDRARAVNEISKTIIDTARVEVDFIKTQGEGCSDFISRLKVLPCLSPETALSASSGIS